MMLEALSVWLSPSQWLSFLVPLVIVSNFTSVTLLNLPSPVESLCTPAFRISVAAERAGARYRLPSCSNAERSPWFSW